MSRDYDKIGSRGRKSSGSTTGLEKAETSETLHQTIEVPGMEKSLSALRKSKERSSAGVGKPSDTRATASVELPDLKKDETGGTTVKRSSAFLRTYQWIFGSKEDHPEKTEGVITSLESTEFAPNPSGGAEVDPAWMPAEERSDESDEMEYFTDIPGTSFVSVSEDSLVSSSATEEDSFDDESSADDRDQKLKKYQETHRSFSESALKLTKYRKIKYQASSSDKKGKSDAPEAGSPWRASRKDSATSTRDKLDATDYASFAGSDPESPGLSGNSISRLVDYLLSNSEVQKILPGFKESSAKKSPEQAVRSKSNDLEGPVPDAPTSIQDLLETASKKYQILNRKSDVSSERDSAHEFKKDSKERLSSGIDSDYYSMGGEIQRATIGDDPRNVDKSESVSSKYGSSSGMIKPCEAMHQDRGPRPSRHEGNVSLPLLDETGCPPTLNGQTRPSSSDQTRLKHVAKKSSSSKPELMKHMFDSPGMNPVLQDSLELCSGRENRPRRKSVSIPFDTVSVFPRMHDTPIPIRPSPSDTSGLKTLKPALKKPSQTPHRESASMEPMDGITFIKPVVTDSLELYPRRKSLTKSRSDEDVVDSEKETRKRGIAEIVEMVAQGIDPNDTASLKELAEVLSEVLKSRKVSGSTITAESEKNRSIEEIELVASVAPRMESDGDTVASESDRCLEKARCISRSESEVGQVKVPEEKHPETMSKVKTRLDSPEPQSLPDSGPVDFHHPDSDAMRMLKELMSMVGDLCQKLSKPHDVCSCKSSRDDLLEKMHSDDSRLLPKYFDFKTKPDRERPVRKKSWTSGHRSYADSFSPNIESISIDTRKCSDGSNARYYWRGDPMSDESILVYPVFKRPPRTTFPASMISDSLPEALSIPGVRSVAATTLLGYSSVKTVYHFGANDTELIEVFVDNELRAKILKGDAQDAYVNVMKHADFPPEGCNVSASTVIAANGCQLRTDVTRVDRKETIAVFKNDRLLCRTGNSVFE